jgi:hypothetical protein
VATPQSIPELENPTLHEMGIDHPNNGRIVVFAKPGWAMRDPVRFNPLPGNHGHPETQPSVLMVAGGHPVLDDEPESVPGERVFDPASRPFSPPAGGPGNLSVAPTVAALFGIGEPAGGYDAGPLREAFEPWALSPHAPGTAAPAPPTEDCAGTVTETQNKNLRVPGGARCVLDADVNGNVFVEGDLVVLPSRTVSGSVELQRAGAGARLEGASVKGSVLYKERGTVELSGARVDGSVTIEKATSELRFSGAPSRVGGNLEFKAKTDITGTGNATVGGNAKCEGNPPLF